MDLLNNNKHILSIYIGAVDIDMSGYKYTMSTDDAGTVSITRNTYNSTANLDFVYAYITLFGSTGITKFITLNLVDTDYNHYSLKFAQSSLSKVSSYYIERTNWDAGLVLMYQAANGNLKNDPLSGDWKITYID